MSLIALLLRRVSPVTDRPPLLPSASGTRPTSRRVRLAGRLLALGLATPLYPAAADTSTTSDAPTQNTATSEAGGVTPSLLERYSYAQGWFLGQRLQAQVRELDPAAFARAISDALTAAEAQFDETQRRAAVQDWQQAEAERRAAQAHENARRGERYLAANRERPGVEILPSGVQVKVLRAGNGGVRPGEGSRVRVHYEGRTIDGEVFDSSYRRGQPAVFSLQGVIPGFRLALIEMQPGDLWEVSIPAELAYGERGNASIGPNQTLIFKLELLEVE